MFFKRWLQEFGEVTEASCPNWDGKPSMDLPPCLKAVGVDAHVGKLLLLLLLLWLLKLR